MRGEAVKTTPQDAAEAPRVPLVPLFPDVPDDQRDPGILEANGGFLCGQKLTMGDDQKSASVPNGHGSEEPEPEPAKAQNPEEKGEEVQLSAKAVAIIEQVHEQVLTEAMKAPDLPDIEPVTKAPEFPDIPEDAPLTDFQPVSKPPEFADIPEDGPLVDFADEDCVRGTPRTMSRYASRDSLLEEEFGGGAGAGAGADGNRSASMSRNSSFTLAHEVSEVLRDADLLRGRRASDGSIIYESVTMGAGSRSRKTSENMYSPFDPYGQGCMSPSPDVSPEAENERQKSRKMSVVSMAAAARSRSASESDYNRADYWRTPRIRRFSVNVASLGNPKLGRRMRRYSEVGDVVRESLAMLKSSKIPVPKFTKVAKGVSKCCRHPSRDELKPVDLSNLHLPEGAVEECKCCGKRRFAQAATAAFGIEGPPIRLGVTSSNLPSCLVCSPVVCQGDLLRVVQLAGVYPDSKTFVDKKVKQSPEETIRRFQELLQRTGGAPTREQVVDFVNQSFEDGDELEEWTPTDWVESPPILNRILCEDFRAWAAELNKLWKELGRKMKDDVRDNPQLYSLLYVPNGFIIPGGRFRELYYWDTYWIVQGLLLCDMKESVKGIIENLLCLVQKLGFVPNGSRVYYDQRSQPPFLIPMVEAYVKHTGDLDFVRDNMNLIEKEFLFWMNNATVEVKHKSRTYRLARYFSPSDGPRPESYREDVLTAAHLPTEEERQHLYWDIKSAAATGWDFSSRWVIQDGTNGGTLGDLHTRYIVPVDLNAFLYGNAVGLSELYKAIGKEDRAFEYRAIADQWREAVTAVLWHPDQGTWLDYDLLNNTPRRYFYASNLTPLWTRCYDEKEAPEIANATVRYLFNTGVLKYLGGTPTSLMMTGEQWDFPNCWSPMQGMLVQGLHTTGDPGARRLALELARRWLVSNYRGFVEHQQMFEKYGVENIGRSGGGGEYAVQAGFGWTNGVCFEMLHQYGMMASARDDPELLTYDILMEAEDKVLDSPVHRQYSIRTDSEDEDEDDEAPDQESEVNNKSGE